MSTLLALRNLGKTFKYPAAHVNKFSFVKTPPHLTMPPFLTENTRRRLATTLQTTPQPPTSDEWRIMYRLPLIRLASAFNGLKIPYGILNAIAIPGAFALEQASALPPSTAVLIGAVGATTWMTLSICSFFVKNLVGIIYINDTNDRLKLAYVDYWGRRHDLVIDLDDLVPESEHRKPSQFDFIQSLRLYSDEKVNFKLLQRFGSIEDPEAFSSIFGE